jgi:hypothetical protein
MMGLLLAAAMLAADTNHFVVCPTLPPTSDTTRLTVYGRVSDPFTKVSLPAGFAGLVVETVREKMTIPATMPIVVFDSHGRPTIVITAAFSLMANGTAQNVLAMASSSSLAIDSLLIAGIVSAGKDSSFPPLPPGAGNGIRLAFVMSPDSAAGAVPVFSIRVPVWHDYAVPGLRARDVADTVRLSFVVDEHGTPLLGTVHMASALERGVPINYLESLRRIQLVPAHIGRCAVRGLVPAF